MRAVTIVLFLGLAGCASLHSTVFEKIHEGDSKDHVIAVLGQPDSFGASQRIEGATAYYYKSKADMCGITLQNDTVKYVVCGQDPNYRSSGGKFMKGFADGYNGAVRNQTSCQSVTNGNVTQTNCQ